MKLKFLGFTALMSVLALPAYAAQMNVPMNESSVVIVEGEPDAIIVGNPMVADVTMVNGHTLVVHGRLFGNTDVTVLDEDGQELLTVSVSVTDQWRGGLAVHMGSPNQNVRAGSVNYVCNPRCVRALHPGDETTAADNFAGQSGAWQDLTERGMSIGDEGQR